MPSPEEELKSLIQSRYGSLRKFSIDLNMPYTTIDAILKRGVGNASIGNIIKICDALSLSVDELAAGRVTEKEHPQFSPEEDELLRLFQNLNKNGQDYILQTARIVSENPSMQKDDPNSVAV